MKNIPSLLLILIAFFMTATTVVGQNMLHSSGKSATNTPGVKPEWTDNNPFQQNVFIENKGQFDNKNKIINSKIYYGVNDGGFQIYYTPKGLTYRMDKLGLSENNLRKLGEKKEKDERSNQTKDENLKTPEILHSDLIHMEWLDAKPDVEIISEEVVHEYFNYGMENPERNIYKAKAFKKLIYKNIYPFTDVEYTFHKKEGTKYTIILRPGADITKIRMKYTGADHIYTDKNGNIHLATSFGDITDHAPVSFYKDEKNNIKSSFQLTGDNIVTFSIPEFDKTKTLIIDPWTLDPLFVVNKAWDVESDPLGNVYVFGGGSPPFVRHILKKYDAAGNPQWTFTINMFWGDWHGDLAVDNAGNAFVSNTSGTGSMIEIDNTGAQVFLKFGGVVPSGTGEIFCTAFNTPKTQLVGTSHPSTGYVIDINTTTFLGSAGSNITGPIDEIRGLTSSRNGNYYAISCNNGARLSTVIGLRPDLTTLWTVTAGYPFWDFFYSSPAYTGFPALGGLGHTPNGQNCITASNCFVYTYEGKNLKKWDIANGGFVAGVAVPFGTPSQNSGVLVDSCGYVYVGTGKNITKYDPSLNIINTFPTPDSVYCLSFGPTTDTILACGRGFVSSVANTPNPPIDIPFTLTTTKTEDCYCYGTITAIPDICVNTSYTFYYLWSDGQTTQTAVGLCEGDYTVTTTVITECGTGTETATETIVQPPEITLGIVVEPSSCGQNNGTATVSANGGTPPFEYSWNTIPVQTSATATNLSAGTYEVIVTDLAGCPVTLEASITNTDLMIDFSTGTDNCPGCSCKEWIGIKAKNGTPPYTYLWDNNNYDSRYQNELCPGTYNVTITDASGCTEAGSVTVP